MDSAGGGLGDPAGAALARLGRNYDFGVGRDLGEAVGRGEGGLGLNFGQADRGRGGWAEVDGYGVGGGDAADLGDEVEFEEVGVQLDDFPIAGGQGLDVQHMGWGRVKVEVERDLEKGGCVGVGFSNGVSPERGG